MIHILLKNNYKKKNLNQVHIVNRSMLTSSNCIKQLVINNTRVNHLQRRTAALFVNKPIPTQSNNEGLNNNPAIALIRKKKTIVIQHNEIGKIICNVPDCDKKLCAGGEPCSKTLATIAIAHITHSPHHGQVISTHDLEGDSRPQNAIFYDNPHVINNADIDIAKTKILQQATILEAIINNEKSNK